jgi:hypothetical protein
MTSLKLVAGKGDAMAEKRYEYRLWRDRPGGTVLGRVLAPKMVVSDTTDWFDLDDRHATVAKMAALIAAFGSKDGVSGYWLEILDPATGERVTKVEPDERDLDPVVNGNGSRPSLSIEDVSDEVLIRELARRLRAR